jgi:rhodanese-related sulfurtransferase
VDTLPGDRETHPEEGLMLRVRFLIPTLLVAAVLAASFAAACGTQDTGSSAATETPAMMETAPADTGAGYTTVDVQTAYDALNADENAQLVDVREPSEWAETGVPEGAVLVPLGDLQAQATSHLSSDQPVYVICRSGNRSQAGSDILVGLGFTQVYNVDGGVNAWTASGLPTEPYQP